MSKIKNNNTSLQSILDTINNLPEFGSGGIDTSDATATSEDVMLNKTAYSKGEKITGTFTIDEEIENANSLIDAINVLLNNKILDRYNEGEKAQYNEFWDSFQNNGKRTVYDYAFWRWNNTTFKPKYSIMPQGAANSIFREISGIDDLDKWFKDLKITVDLSKATNLNDGFYGFKGTRICEINASNCGSYNFMFSASTKLETIDKLILRTSGTPTYNNMFNSCNNLKNIVIEGEIRNNIDFHWSTLLTHDSLMSIINALITTSTTYTLTLGTENLAKLTDAEKAIATEKGWSLA